MVNDGADHPVDDPYEKPWPKTDPEEKLQQLREIVDSFDQ